MLTPHVHAELIKAWADGAEIELFLGQGLWQIVDQPNWLKDNDYRIKKQPKPKVTRWLWAHKHKASNSPWNNSSQFMTEDEFTKWTSYQGIKLEWSATEFDV